MTTAAESPARVEKAVASRVVTLAERVARARRWLAEQPAGLWVPASACCAT